MLLVYSGNDSTVRWQKPSQHGLGFVFLFFEASLFSPLFSFSVLVIPYSKLGFKNCKEEEIRSRRLLGFELIWLFFFCTKILLDNQNWNHQVLIQECKV